MHAQTVQRYFDAWNAHDSAAIVSTFAAGGSYADPTTPGPLTGDAIGRNAAALWSAFPDASFEIRSHVQAGDGVFAAEWVMRGTNTASFNGLPPTGKAVVLEGADFIRVGDAGIRTVQGYFDAGAIPRQLGLQIVVQPHEVGPVGFGTSVRVPGGPGLPGAFSITALTTGTAEESERVRSFSREVAGGLPALDGFLGFVGVTVGPRMLTITAWESPEDARQVMAQDAHARAMREFFGDLSVGGWTSVWTPHRINAEWSRCEACGKMVTRTADARCKCGAALDPAPAHW